MEVDLHAVREVLDGVEISLKESVRESVSGTYRRDNCSHLLIALAKVQEAVTELLQIRW